MPTIKRLAKFRWVREGDKLIAVLIEIDPKVKNREDFQLEKPFCEISIVTKREVIGGRWTTVTYYETDTEPHGKHRSEDNAAQTAFHWKAKLR